MSFPKPSECVAGDEALARGAWVDARSAFEHALSNRETPEALEAQQFLNSAVLRTAQYAAMSRAFLQ